MKKLLMMCLVVASVFVFASKPLAAEMFATQKYDYRNGYFDNNKDYTVSDPRIINNALDTMGNEATITFNQEKQFSLLGIFVRGFGTVDITFYDESGKVSFSDTIVKDLSWWNDYRYYTFTNVSVKKINIRARDTRQTLGEFEMFTGEIGVPVTDLKVAAEYQSAKISWANPSAQHYNKKIFVNDVLVGSVDAKANSYEIKNLKSNTEYNLKVVVTYDPSEKIESFPASLTFKTKKYEDLGPVTVSDIKHNQATLNYVLPKDILRLDIMDEKGSLVAIKTSGNQHVLMNLKGETDYIYTLQAIYASGEKSNIQEVKFKTLEANREVINLVGTSTEKEISLSWTMPEYKALDYARIYRQKENNNGMVARMFAFAASSTYEPLFETNGTTFKDLTVKADTEYKYKVTTVDTSAKETDGKTITIKTKKIYVSGGGTDTNENGDYVITWTSPTTGKIKVMVGGKQYAIVPASDKKIVIPKNDMVFNIIGNPDVKLIPIDENGNEGETTSPGAGPGTGNGGGIGDIVGGGDLAEVLNPENTIKSGVQLLALVGAFVLLGLAFRVVPKLVRTIRNAFVVQNENYGKRRIRE